MAMHPAMVGVPAEVRSRMSGGEAGRAQGGLGKRVSAPSSLG